MRILGLPGRQPTTLQAMADVLASLAAPEDGIMSQRYGFWNGDFTNPDIEPEAVRAGKAGADLVVALSIGALVAMAARQRHGLAAGAYVFIGTPLNRLAAEGRSYLLAEQAAAVPTLFIQRSRDPTGSFADLSKLLPSGQVRELPGAEHDYGDTGAIVALVKAWR